MKGASKERVIRNDRGDEEEVCQVIAGVVYMNLYLMKDWPMLAELEMGG
jgi:hypothetical protein